MHTIESFDSYVLRIPFTPSSADYAGAMHELMVVEVSGGGETGLGYCFITDVTAGASVKRLVDDLLGPRLIGQPVRDVERIFTESIALTHRMGEGHNRFAIAAIDIALWDLRSRVDGLPLARALGQIVDSVPVYGSGKAGGRLSTDKLVELSVGYAQEGLAGVKIRVGLEPTEDPKRVAAVRSEVGDDLLIMCDANERLDLPGALHLGRRLSESDVYWFEEPIDRHDIRAHEILGQRLPMAITGGEHHCAAEEFVPYTSSAFQILQPNACMVGGITEIMRIARLAELHGLGFAPHLMTELHVHVAAATTSTSYLEYFPFLEPFITQPLKLDDGRAVVPDTPGHGIRFTPEALERWRTH